MLKQIFSIIIIILLSAIVIVTMPYVHQVLDVLISAYRWILQILTEVFSGGFTGNLIRNVIALLIIPLFVGLIPAIVYWLAKRSAFPYFMNIVWIVWLVQASALIAQYKP